MRRANGSGQIFKMKGEKRRKPWRVRVTFGWVTDEATGKTKQIVKSLGCFASRREAEAALVEYQSEPYDISDKDITFRDLYERWSKEYFANITSASSIRTVTSSYNYMHPLYNYKVRDLRVRHLERCISKCYAYAGSEKELFYSVCRLCR